jgi:hypothetical protein
MFDDCVLVAVSARAQDTHVPLHDDATLAVRTNLLLCFLGGSLLGESSTLLFTILLSLFGFRFPIPEATT